MKIVTTIIAALCWLGWSAGAAQPSSATEVGTVYVVSALRGAPATIVLDEQTIGTQTKPVTILGPFQLAAGSHRILVQRNNTALAKASFTVTAGNQLEVVAHPNADAASRPTVTVFANTPASGNTAILATTNIAAMPPLNVYVNNALVHRDLSGGQTRIATSASNKVSVRVESVAGRTQLLPPTIVTLAPGSFTRLYLVAAVDRILAVPHVISSQAIGAAGAGAPAEAAGVVTPYSSASPPGTDQPEPRAASPAAAANQVRPTRVATGDGGQAAHNSWSGLPLALTAGAASLAAGGALVWWYRQRARSLAAATVPQHGR